MIVFKFLFLLSLTVWFGSLVFFSFIGAPAIFKSLPREQAGDLAGIIFPKYYIVGLVCGLIALACLLIVSMAGGIGSAARIILLILMIGTTLYAGFFVSKKAQVVKYQLRTATEEVLKQDLQKQFGSLHQQSVMLNSAVLLMGVVVIFLTAVQLRS